MQCLLSVDAFKAVKHEFSSEWPEVNAVHGFVLYQAGRRVSRGHSFQEIK
jgi:hypothetical protein